ncbi:MAG: hypothetical protein Q9203_001319 [Teloschistes exilis]
MDPLSITTGVIAIIGVVDQAAKCIQKLRAIRQAPQELRLLINEVADLWEVLRLVETAQRPPEYRESALPLEEEEAAKGLDRLIARISGKLLELDSLLDHHWSHTQRRMPDFSWIRGKQRADALRADLTQLRMNISTALSATACATVSRVESAVERLNSEQLKSTQVLTSLVGRLGLKHQDPISSNFQIDQKQCNLNLTLQYPVQPEEIAHFTDPKFPREGSTMTRRIPGTLKPSAPPTTSQPLHIHARKGTGACQSWCSCACHAKNVLRTNRRNGLASLSISYSGLPWVTAKCDQKSCRSRSLPAVALNIQFPSWLWKQYLSSSFVCSPLHTTNLNFALSRTVSWMSSLWRHGLDGNVRAIQDLFSEGLASPFDVQALGGSVLHYATDHGHWDLCKFLIGEGAMLDNEDDFHNTPTTLAWEKVLSGALTEDVASMVSNMFADTDFMQTRQFSIVHKIVLHLIPRSIESELDYSTRDLDAVDSSGRTPIAWAAVRGDELALNTLIGYSADVNLADGQGNTPLHHARNAACVDILLAAGADKTARNIFGHTPLHMVCRGTGSLALLKCLVAAGVDIDATDKSGETALATATFNSHVDCASLLVHSGADINIANRANDAPIHLALQSDVPAVLQLLLNKGAKYQEPNNSGRTILHYAAGLVSAETIQILKAHGLLGIDLDAKDDQGKTVDNLLEERVDDDSDPLFKSRLQDLLDSVRIAPSRTELAVPETPEMKIEVKGPFGMIKDEPVVLVTSVAPGDEDDVYDVENDTHGPAVFFDAVEDIQQGLQAIPIVA